MEEAEAREWLSASNVPRETVQRLEHFILFLRDTNLHHNLIARSTVNALWSRHVVDSAQLLTLADDSRGPWLDVGSGAGLPGLVLAILGAEDMTLVEPRRLRADFLCQAVEKVGLNRSVKVVADRVERMAPGTTPYAVITARAVAPLPTLFAAARHLSDPTTIWLLPKGRSAAEELEAARQSWHGEFRLQPSVTDPAAAIVVARNVYPRNRR